MSNTSPLPVPEEFCRSPLVVPNRCNHYCRFHAVTPTGLTPCPIPEGFRCEHVCVVHGKLPAVHETETFHDICSLTASLRTFGNDGKYSITVIEMVPEYPRTSKIEILDSCGLLHSFEDPRAIRLTTEGEAEARVLVRAFKWLAARICLWITKEP